MAASRSALTKKRPTLVSVSRADEDSYFKALSAATERRQRAEPQAKKIERTNREQYGRQVIRWDAAERARLKSAKANQAKAKIVESRLKLIAEVWPKACETHPRSLSKRYDWILERVEEHGHVISYETLIQRDLVKLRARGALVSLAIS